MKRTLFAGTALLAVAVAQPADAQTADQQPATADQNTTAQQDGSTKTDGVIVVTAQRREEALTDVPVAISVFTSEDRDRIGIRTIQDYANFTPGMSFSTSLDRISVRGVGRLTNIIGSDPGVATYNDGFYTASAAEASKTPMFVDRIEILRGPQGTLYGRNSVGGALNVISKRPLDEWGGEFRATIDKLGGAIAEGFVSGPVSDAFKVRLSAQMGPRALGETFHNISGLAADEGGLNRFLVEAQLQYDFSPGTQLWLKYSHAEWDDHFRSANLATPYVTTSVMPSGALVPNAAFNYTVPNPGVTDPFTINTNTRHTQSLTDNHNFVVNFTASLGGAALKYVGGYSQYYYDNYQDLDFTPRSLVATSAGTLGAVIPSVTAFNYTYNPTYVQEYIEDKEYYSNEVTLASEGSAALSWIVGLYQYHEHFFQPITWYQGGDGTDSMGKALPAPLCVNNLGGVDATCPANPRRSFYAGTGDLTIDSYAAFGQADYEIAPGFKLTTGLRYSSDKKTGVETYRLVNWNPTSPSASCFNLGCGAFTPALDITRLIVGVPGSGPVARTLKGKWDGLTWRLAADWKPTDTTLLFASYARGLKAGGFNLGSYAENPTVDKEQVDSFEAGVKATLARGFNLNVTGFYYNYNDPQIPITVQRVGSAFTSTNFFNIPKATSKGLEVETAWYASRWLELHANYSYLNAKITSTARAFDDPGTPSAALVDIDGNRLPQSSKHQVAISSLLDIAVGDASLFLAASYIYRSHFYSSVFQTAQNRVPGYDRVDLRATYVTPDKRMTLIGYVRNVFDTVGYDGVAALTGTGSGGFGQVFSYTQPRTYGIEFQAKF